MGSSIFLDEHEGYAISYHGNRKLNTAVLQSIEYEIQQFMNEHCFTGTALPAVRRYAEQVIRSYIDRDFIINGYVKVNYYETTWQDLYPNIFKRWYARFLSHLPKFIVRKGITRYHLGGSTYADRFFGMTTIYEKIPVLPNIELNTDILPTEKVVVTTKLLVPAKVSECEVYLRFCTPCPEYKVLCKKSYPNK